MGIAQRRIAAFALSLALAGCGHAAQSVVQPPASHANGFARGASVKHVVILEMENRSFDSFFGTYPGVNGIPSNVTCNPDPQSGQCIYPYHDTSTINYGGPHGVRATRVDLDGGALDGFVKAAEQKNNLDPDPDEVMGYHTCAEIPTYCQYASRYTLADNFFAATSSWSTMAHLFLVSGWSAKCTVPGDPMSCVSNNDINIKNLPDYPWTDLTWLLHAAGVSWGYYVYDQQHPMVPGDGDDERPGPNDGPTLGGAWNPLPLFDDVKADGQLGDIQSGTNFDAQVAAGTLPVVSWVIPSFNESDHPNADLVNGQAWVKHVVDELQASPQWSSTIVFLQWDEWGGFYDHVVPPVIDKLGYGFRSPLIIIGPMVKSGHIDHQLLSSDAELKFIEDLFLGSERIDANDGRPDSRPDVREIEPALGDLRKDLTL